MILHCSAFHKMEREGMGMNGQERLFLRRVLTVEIDDGKESGFIWRDEDEDCDMCC